MPKVLQRPLLYLVTDTALCGKRSVEDVVQQAVLGGVNLVQLREKNLSTREFVQLGQRLKLLLQPYKIPLIINDRLDIALAIDADGVHLGQSDMPYELAKNMLGPEKIIGLTVNTIAQVQAAGKYVVDYLGVGPVFDTQTKKDAGEAWSIHDLQMARKISRYLLVGIGGININNAATVMQLGFDGIAVVSAICVAPDPKISARKLREAIGMAI